MNFHSQLTVNFALENFFYLFGVINRILYGIRIATIYKQFANSFIVSAMIYYICSQLRKDISLKLGFIDEFPVSIALYPYLNVLSSQY